MGFLDFLRPSSIFSFFQEQGAQPVQTQGRAPQNAVDRTGQQYGNAAAQEALQGNTAGQTQTQGQGQQTGGQTTTAQTTTGAGTTAVVPTPAAPAAPAVVPGSTGRFYVKDRNAMIRTPPTYASTGERIPYGTAVQISESSADGRYAHVTQVGGTGDWWTARSNLGAVSDVLASDQLNEAALTAAGTAAVAVAPETLRTYAQAAIPLILRQAALLNVRNSDQVAYMLATAEHESKFGRPNYDRSTSLVEDSNPLRAPAQPGGQWTSRNHVTGRAVSGASQDELETNYWDDAYGGRLGNVAGTTDARNYRGRGYVQITGRDNYEKMSAILNAQSFTYTLDGVTYGGQGNPAVDLVANYDHVNRVPALAARLLAEGSMQGHYTGRALGDYVNGQGTDFTNARRVINGDTNTVEPGQTQSNGERIATVARRYAAALAGAVWTGVFTPAGQQPGQQP